MSLRKGLTLVELLLVVGLIAVLCALLLPVLFASRRSASDAACPSRHRQLLMAVKMYEGDHGIVPVHAQGAATWQDQVWPYVKSAEVFLCPVDPSRGESYRWGWSRPTSFAYTLNEDTARLFGGYQPASRSPMLLCNHHEYVYQAIIGRYDGSIELAPMRKYRRIHYEGAAWDGKEPP